MNDHKPFRAQLEDPWRGMLAADWPTVPLRRLARFITGKTPDKSKPEYWRDGTIPWVSPKDMKVDLIGDSIDHITQLAIDDKAAQQLPTGCVLVVVRSMILIHSLPVAVTTRPVAINQDIKALECGPRIRPDFLKAVIMGQSPWLLSFVGSAGHGTKLLPTEVLQNFEVPCPPLYVQDRIAAQLSQKIGNVDALIAAKERALRLIAEKQKVIIVTSATRGISPMTQLGRTDLPWLREIPSHWEVRKLGQLGRVGSGATPARDRAEYWENGTLPWLTSAVVNQEEVTSSDEFVTDLAVREYHLPRLRPGAVLVAISGQGKTRGQAVVLSAVATINQHLVFIQPNSALVDSWYLRWVLYAAHDFLRSISSGSTREALRREDIVTLRLPVPPIEEQRSIARHIAQQSAILHELRAATGRTIELLKERRAALFVAAAKGKICGGGVT